MYNTNMIFKYQQAILGGTFDRFHLGHQYLIETAFEGSEKVTIGIATAELIQKKFLADSIEDYQVRKGSLTAYLKQKNYLPRAEIIALDDIYGNTLTEKNIQAIFVTKATLPNAKLINFKREKIGFLPLKIITVPFLKGDDGKIITSERIRNGEIDRNGNAYINLFKRKLILPIDLREKLRKPVGAVVENLKDFKKLKQVPLVVAVGDIVAILCSELGYPDISIIDFKTRREPIEKEKMTRLPMKNVSKTVNQPGTINSRAASILCLAIKKYFATKEKQTIVVNGEEDLLALPAILLSPLESIVVYGQYGLGSVVVEVTEEKKKQVEEILKKFNLA